MTQTKTDRLQWRALDGYKPEEKAQEAILDGEPIGASIRIVSNIMGNEKAWVTFVFGKAHGMELEEVFAKESSILSLKNYIKNLSKLLGINKDENRNINSF